MGGGGEASGPTEEKFSRHETPIGFYRFPCEGFARAPSTLPSESPGFRLERRVARECTLQSAEIQSYLLESINTHTHTLAPGVGGKEGLFLPGWLVL